MGSDNMLPKLSLELSPPFTPQTISEFLRELNYTQQKSHKLSKLDNYIHGLEDELRKIEAFKRELPLSVVLLSDAISTLKDELSKCTDAEVRSSSPLTPTEEKCNSEESIELELGCAGSQKKTWMSSAQLWNPDSNSLLQLNNSGREDADRTLSGSGNGRSGYQQRQRFCPMSGANMSFEENSGISGVKQQDNRDGNNMPLPVPGLSLVMPGLKSPVPGEAEIRKPTVCGVGAGGGGVTSSSVLMTDHIRLSPNKTSSPQHQQSPYNQSARKQRRCWSPDLHRRFVDALEKLGGSQVATPKQIRELMQVDGLTNDEVKSHLQKYRLHIRKVPASSSTQSNDKLTTSQDNHANTRLEGCSKMDISQSGSPEGPLHSAITSAKCSSGGDSSNEEEEDDRNSVGHSWKSSSASHHQHQQKQHNLMH